MAEPMTPPSPLLYRRNDGDWGPECQLTRVSVSWLRVTCRSDLSVPDPTNAPSDVRLVVSYFTTVRGSVATGNRGLVDPTTCPTPSRSGRKTF